MPVQAALKCISGHACWLMGLVETIWLWTAATLLELILGKDNWPKSASP
jgi:hypothetical protein